MWKYRHPFKEIPKDRYDWSATRQCACQREQWKCRRPCAQSKRDLWDLVWNWHLPIDCAQNNNSSRSPAQVCQTTSSAESAPTHSTRRDTIQLLQREAPDFIGPDLWPPNSPDLNPVDYKIWGLVQQRVYKCRVSNVDELKQRLVEVWDDLQQTVIDSAVS